MKAAFLNTLVHQNFGIKFAQIPNRIPEKYSGQKLEGYQNTELYTEDKNV